ncbi:MAG: endonuclease V [Archaeoglobus sp.]|nr:MAG: endonuclease V [Archaeoglobus sp.]
MSDLRELIRKIEENPPKTLTEMKKIQLILSNAVVLEGKCEAEYFAGVDQAFIGDTVISACVVLDSELKPVRKIVHAEKTEVPYIPTYLMFREGRSAINAVRKALKGINKKDVCLIVDGSGIAHPRKCGLATYIGLAVNVQSVGVTKSKLYGYYSREPDLLESVELVDEIGGVIGYVLKTCKKCKPIFISPGHRISPEGALEAVIQSLKGYKLPEPIRLAHNLATTVRKSGNLTLNSFNSLE